jgi:FkbM family methyltransferase
MSGDHLHPPYEAVSVPFAAAVASYWWRHRLRGATLVSRACAALLRRRDCRLRVGNDVLLLPFADPIAFLYLAGGVLNTFCVGALRQVVRPGAVVYDIGANYGLFGWQAIGPVGPEGRVVLFEPNPVVAERLRDNLVANDVANATVVEKAVSDREGTAELLAPVGRQSGLATVDPTGQARPGWRRCVVATVSVDEFARQSGLWPSVLKLDVEGHELSVLRGAEGTLAQCHPVVLLEFEILAREPDGETARQVLALLQRHGYGYLYAASHTQLRRVTYADATGPITDLIAATDDLGLLET